MYIVVSTSSMVILPWISFMALPAFFMATSVSWLMFADSMEYICCSSMDIWPFVCSRECSCCFFRFRALRATMMGTQNQVSSQTNITDPVILELFSCTYS